MFATLYFFPLLFALTPPLSLPVPGQLFSIMHLNICAPSLTQQNHATLHSNSASSYTKGRILGYQRSHHYQNKNCSLVQIEGVTSKADTEFYLGKRVAFVYRAQTAKAVTKGNAPNPDQKVRVIWGKITRPHGNSGVVRTRFRVNLPAKTMGATVRVMLYPSRV